MKIVLINGTNKKGSTYHIGRMLADKIGGEIEEVFLPRDFSEYCVGCFSCIRDSESKCPHAENRDKITEKLDAAELIIMTSPVYCYHVSGQMKTLLDHYAFRWMVHRPEAGMFTKQAVAISTAAGQGTKWTNKDMSDSFFFWGIGKYYSYGMAVGASCWEEVNEKKVAKIEKATDKLAVKIKKKQGKVKPGIKTKAFFNIMRLMQKNGWCEADVKYWKERGWTEKKRPWK